jgi:hypothetical protein
VLLCCCAAVLLCCCAAVLAVRSFVWYGREGLCRFALRPYSSDPARLSDQSIHLTNYTLNANTRISEPPAEQPPQLIPDDREGKTADQLRAELDAARTSLQQQIEDMAPIAGIKALQHEIADLTHRHGMAELSARSPGLQVPQPKTARKIVQPTIKWTLTHLDQHLRSEHAAEDVDMAWHEISELVLHTLRSAQGVCAAEAAAHVPYRGNCFELFGFDVMLDEALKPWLIEVNLSPSLECPTGLDHSIKAPLVADTFNIVGVPMVPIAGTMDSSPARQRPEGTEEEAQDELARSLDTAFWRVSPQALEKRGEPRFRFGVPEPLRK